MTPTDQGMVERVARAMWESSSLQSWDGNPVPGGCRISVLDRQVYRDHAVAAINAMRDATPEMQALFTAARPESPCAVWNKVLDAALSAPVASMGGGKPVHAETNTQTVECDNAR